MIKATHKQFKLFHGWILPQFCEAVGLPSDAKTCDDVKSIVKRYLHVPYTSELSEKEMRTFINTFLMLAAREFGVYIQMPPPEDPDNAEAMTLGEYLNYKQNYDRI